MAYAGHAADNRCHMVDSGDSGDYSQTDDYLDNNRNNNSSRCLPRPHNRGTRVAHGRNWIPGRDSQGSSFSDASANGSDHSILHDAISKSNLDSSSSNGDRVSNPPNCASSSSDASATGSGQSILLDTVPKPPLNCASFLSDASTTGSGQSILQDTVPKPPPNCASSSSDTSVTGSGQSTLKDTVPKPPLNCASFLSDASTTGSGQSILQDTVPKPPPNCASSSSDTSVTGSGQSTLKDTVPKPPLNCASFLSDTSATGSTQVSLCDTVSNPPNCSSSSSDASTTDSGQSIINDTLSNDPTRSSFSSEAPATVPGQRNFPYLTPLSENPVSSSLNAPISSGQSVVSDRRNTTPITSAQSSDTDTIHFANPSKRDNRSGSSCTNVLSGHVDVANDSDGSGSSNSSSSSSNSSNSNTTTTTRFHDGLSGQVDVANVSDGSISSNNSNSSGSSSRTLLPDVFSGQVGVVSSSDGYTEPTDFFVETETLQKPQQSRLLGPRVLNSLLDTCNADTPSEPSALLKELQKYHNPQRRADLSRCVQNVLPQLARNKQFGQLAAFLRVNDHQSLAISHLQTMLLDLHNSQDTLVSEELLAVSQLSLDACLDLCEKDVNFLPMTALHLMAVAALLSRCPKPPSPQCRALAESVKQSRKKKDGKLKALQVFEEGLEAVLGKASSFQQWSQAGFSQEERDRRKQDLGGASFSEVVVHVYTLINELWNQRSAEHCRNLLQTLHDLYSSTTAARKPKIGEEPKLLLDFFLTWGICPLLRTTFDGEETQIGDQKGSDRTELITSLLLDVVKSAKPAIKSSVLRELECLPFHISTRVRETFNCYFSGEGYPLDVLQQGYMSSKLRVIDFQRSHHCNSVERQKAGDVVKCGWHSSACTVGQQQAQVSVYTPRAGCMAGAALDKCCMHHPGAEEGDVRKRSDIMETARRHERNLDLLKALSPQSRHIVTLFSYQLLPFPFYVTEAVQDRRLISSLLDHRHKHQWLCDKDLRNIMLQVLEILIFLNSRSIDPRDVTAYNMVVQPGASGTRKGSSAFTQPGFVIKLADLGLGHEYLNNDAIYMDTGVRRVRSQGPVPVRWTSPEGLFQGLYGERNMVYSAGCVMYELWTHGCQPFTSYDQTQTTEDILKMMVTEPGSVQLFKHPCIPHKTQGLIAECTNHVAEKRPSLLSVKQRLSTMFTADTQQVREPGVGEALSLEKRYPQISKSQQDRHHKPETGTPGSIKELLEIDAAEQSECYATMRVSKRSHPSHTVVTAEELKAKDWITIQNQEDRTVVKEVVTPKFVIMQLPDLESCDVGNVVCWKNAKEETSQEAPLIQVREYPASVSLKMAVQNGYLLHHEPEPYDLANGEETFGLDRVLVPLCSLARTVHALHEKGWVLRELKEDNILIDCNSGQVILPRIGRMHRLGSSETFLVADKFSDILRWLAFESLFSGQYSKESDIFSLGTVIMQVYRIHEKAVWGQDLSDRNLAPCPNIHEDKVIDFIRDEGRDESKPWGCPQWLWELIVQCRLPEPSRRPLAKDVMDKLRDHCPDQPVDQPFILHPYDGDDEAVAMREAVRSSDHTIKKRPCTDIATNEKKTPWGHIANIASIVRGRNQHRGAKSKKRVAFSPDSQRRALWFDGTQTEVKVIDTAAVPPSSGGLPLRSQSPSDQQPVRHCRHDQDQTEVKGVSTATGPPARGGPPSRGHFPSDRRPSRHLRNDEFHQTEVKFNYFGQGQLPSSFHRPNSPGQPPGGPGRPLPIPEELRRRDASDAVRTSAPAAHIHRHPPARVTTDDDDANTDINDSVDAGYPVPGHQNTYDEFTGCSLETRGCYAMLTASSFPSSRFRGNPLASSSKSCPKLSKYPTEQLAERSISRDHAQDMSSDSQHQRIWKQDRCASAHSLSSRTYLEILSEEESSGSVWSGIFYEGGRSQETRALRERAGPKPITQTKVPVIGGPKPNTRAKIRTKRGPERNTHTKTRARAIPESNTESKTRARAIPEPNTQTKTRTRTRPEPNTQTKTRTRTRPEPNTQTKTRTRTRPEPNTQTKTRTRTRPESNTQTKTRTRTRPEINTQTKTRTRTIPEINTQTKTPARTSPEVNTQTKTPARTGPEPNTQTKKQTRTIPEINTQTKTPARTGPEHNTQAKTPARTSPEINTQDKTTARTSPEINTQAKTLARVSSEPNTQTKTRTRVSPEPNTQTNTRTRTRPETNTDTKTRARTGPESNTQGTRALTHASREPETDVHMKPDDGSECYQNLTQTRASTHASRDPESDVHMNSDDGREYFHHLTHTWASTHASREPETDVHMKPDDGSECYKNLTHTRASTHASRDPESDVHMNSDNGREYFHHLTHTWASTHASREPETDVHMQPDDGNECYQNLTNTRASTRVCKEPETVVHMGPDDEREYFHHLTHNWVSTHASRELATDVHVKPDDGSECYQNLTQTQSSTHASRKSETDVYEISDDEIPDDERTVSCNASCSLSEASAMLSRGVYSHHEAANSSGAGTVPSPSRETLSWTSYIPQTSAAETNMDESIYDEADDVYDEI